MMKNFQSGIWSSGLKPSGTGFKPYNNFFPSSAGGCSRLTPLPTLWDLNWLPCAVSMGYEVGLISSLLLLTSWVCEEENTVHHVYKTAAVLLLWVVLVFFFFSNLVCRQNLSLERVKTRFPREMGQEGEMICLRSESVKIHVAGSFQGSRGN